MPENADVIKNFNLKRDYIGSVSKLKTWIKIDPPHQLSDQVTLYYHTAQ